MRMCLIDNKKVCDDCEQCDRCDLDNSKLCDSCCKCIDKAETVDYAEIEIDEIIGE